MPRALLEPFVDGLANDLSSWENSEGDFTLFLDMKFREAADAGSGFTNGDKISSSSSGSRILDKGNSRALSRTTLIDDS